MNAIWVLSRPFGLYLRDIHMTIISNIFILKNVMPPMPPPVSGRQVLGAKERLATGLLSFDLRYTLPLLEH